MSYFKRLQSYLSERLFRVRINRVVTNKFSTKSRVPQGTVIGPLLYLLYTLDLPINRNTVIGTFVEDTVILASHSDLAVAPRTLQNHLNQIQTWLQKWKIKINGNKSAPKREHFPPIHLNNIPIPPAPASTQQTNVEGARSQDMKTKRTKSEKFELDDWKTVHHVPAEQIIIAQSNLDVCK